MTEAFLLPTFPFFFARRSPCAPYHKNPLAVLPKRTFRCENKKYRSVLAALDLPGVKDAKTVHVASGEGQAPVPSSNIREGYIELKKGSIPGVFGDKTSFEVHRPEIALILYPENVQPSCAVVFGSGFSQAADNYRSTLRHLAAHNYLVLAPETSIYDIWKPWVRVDPLPLPTASPLLTSAFQDWFDLPGKLQRALETDMLRCIDYVRSYRPDIRVGLAGHSMGGGVAILTAFRYRDDADVCAVCVMAPAQGEDWVAAKPLDARVPFSRALVESKCAVHMISDARDVIVPPAQVMQLFEDIVESSLDKNLLSQWTNIDVDHIDVASYQVDHLLSVFVDGQHIGYEDRVGPDLLDWLLYRVSPFAKVYKQQRLRSMELLRLWFDLHLKRDTTLRAAVFNANQVDLTIRAAPAVQLP